MPFKRKYAGGSGYISKRARGLLRHAGFKRRRPAFRFTRSRKRYRRSFPVRRRPGLSRIARGRRVPSGTGFNAPTPKTKWHIRKTSRPDRKTKQLCSTISTEAKAALRQAINVVPDVPNTSDDINLPGTLHKDHMAMNSSLGNREAYTRWADSNFDSWEWTHLNGGSTIIPWNIVGALPAGTGGGNNPTGAAQPTFDLHDTAAGGKNGIFMYRFNPLDMENWEILQAEYNWIRILGMELVITPNWYSRYSKGNAMRAPDVQTRMSNMIDYKGTINWGGTSEKKGFFTEMHTDLQPLNAELFVKKFNSFTEVAAGQHYGSTADFIEHGVHPINIESGRKVTIKVKPTNYLSTFMNSAANFQNEAEANKAFTKVPSQWVTTDAMWESFEPTNFDDVEKVPALATVGLLMKNVPVTPIMANMSALNISRNTVGEDGVGQDMVFVAPTKQLGYATVEVIYHYQVKGTKRPPAIADPMEDD